MVAVLVGVELALEANLGRRVNAIRCDADIEHQGFAIGNGNFADVIDRSILLDLTHGHAFALTGEVDNVDTDIGFDRNRTHCFP